MTRSRPRSFAQRAMEARPIVRVYESRLWRRSVLVRFVLGLSFEREYQQILAAARLGASSAVLDLACGSGIYTRPFARAVPGGSVVGLDLSRPMLAYAHESAARAGLRNLFLVRGDAMRLPFPDARFDLVNCCGALHLFPDATKALAEVERVLRPAGRFTVAAVRRDVGALAPLAGVLRGLGVESFTPDELASRLRAARLGDVRIHHARALWVIASAQKAG